MDFIDLNKACPKDPFPVPKIDQLIDATFWCPRMSFFDAFQGYLQIALAPKDQEKTSFITPISNFHYRVMPFRLKNCEVHLSKDGYQDVQREIGKEYGGLYR